MMEEEILCNDQQQIEPCGITDKDSVVGKLLVAGCKTWAWHQIHKLLLVHGNKWVSLSVLIDVPL